MRTSSVVIAFSFFAAATAFAAPIPQQSAIVEVICDTRLGTGSLTSLNDGGYVVTVGHVAIDPQTHVPSAQCVVGFISDDTLEPTTYYHASVEHAVFDERLSRDYAVLKLGTKISGKGSLPTVPLMTDEFAAVGDSLTMYGFPESSKSMQAATGTVKTFRRGEVASDVPITPGYSGGPALDAHGNMIAIADRVNFVDDPKTGVRTIIDYDLGDILGLITWMDTFGYRRHDTYLTHADPARFDNAHLTYRHEESGCDYVVATPASSSLYCLLNGPYRLVFPNEAVYYSWFPDFSNVENITGVNLAEYQLIGNVSMRAGSLVKIQTDPKVYVVTDSIGTLRWVPNEDLAKTLFGTDWAKQVHDVPVEFFLNYHVADPLQ